jgi:hypothetical protein
MTDDTFKSRWLARLELPALNWKPTAAAHLAALPFCDRKSGKVLIEFLLGKLPQILVKGTQPATASLAEAFGWACLAFWQCGSGFPSFPENYAQFLHNQLKLPVGKRAPEADVITRILLGEMGKKKTDPACGFNRLQMEHAQVVRDSEGLIHEGRYEDYLKAGEKYEEYEIRLRFSDESEAHFFVHANADPHTPLESQVDHTLFWEHLSFAPAAHVSGKTMVCGHTTQKDGRPRHFGNAMCVDTNVHDGG